MKVSILILLVSLIALCSVASFASGAECGAKCMERHKRMVSHREKNTVIRLNSAMYKELLRTAPRDYTVVLLATALSDRRGCIPCQAAAEEYRIIADNYNAQHPDSNVFFTLADFDQGGEEIFHKLECKSAPIFFYFQTSGKPSRSLNQMTSADEIANFVHKKSGLKIDIKRPVNWTKLIFTISVLAGAAIFLYFFFDHVVNFLSNPSLWAYFAIAFSLLMMGGQMWLQIRGAPFTQNKPDGSMSFYSDTTQHQFGVEVYVLMAIQGAITVGVILLGDHAPVVSGAWHRLMTIVGCAIVIFVFSLLVKVFRDKAGHYPYKILF